MDKLDILYFLQFNFFLKIFTFRPLGKLYTLLDPGISAMAHSAKAGTKIDYSI